ncbi:MAG: DUF4145 domain-containing protein [Bacteroidales bacterium]|nr:DUF4145 domain-containing protein [Bacteroidales bacterium]
MPKLEEQLQLKRCPHCNVDSPSLHSINKFSTNNYSNKYQRTWINYRCARCGGVILAAAIQGGLEIIEMYPNGLNVNEAIPKRAKEYLEQAINSMHAPAGAIMLASSSIDAMLKNKGYKEGSLYTRINKAAKEHLITDGMSKWAHQVRLDANEQRHADEEFDMPNEEDAKKVINFTIALAEFMFVLPSKVEKGIKDSK